MSEGSRVQSRIKDGWARVTALHTVQLEDSVANFAGHNQYQKAMVEILARRWQDRCHEVRITFDYTYVSESGRSTSLQGA